MDVQLIDRRIQVGEESRSLISGEMHYWRLNSDNWPTILKQIQDLDLNIISTYVPWQYHEIASGQFDFEGRTTSQRDLLRFLEMAAEKDFWVLLRPGPYIYSEWVNMGVPDRVAIYHRLHPKFLQAATSYMRAVVEATRPYLATNNGPVVLLQADNEPEPWVRFYADQLGLAREPGPFQDFLRRRYDDDIDVLNEVWQTHYTTFEQTRAVMTPTIIEPTYINRYLDYRRFVYWYSTEIGRWAADTYRELGVDVPIYLNFYPMMSLQNWRELEASGVMAGPDYYMQNEFRRDSWEHQEYLHLLRYTRTYSNLPVIPEFQAGSWHGWHYASGSLSARHHHMAAISALLAGIAGWNWYMLVNRDNWYMAPINEWGRTRPELYATFQQIVNLCRKIDPPALQKLTDTALALDILDRSSEIGGFSDPVLTALYQADVDYECCDLATGRIAKPLLFYSGGHWLAADSQQRLVEHVENGGNLVFFDKLPVLDETMRPLNLLELAEPDGIAGPGNLILHLDDDIAISPTTYFNYTDAPDTPLLATRRLDAGYEAEEGAIHFHLPVGYSYTIGYRQQRGQGSIIVLGVPPSPEIVLAVHRWLKVPLYSRAQSSNIHTALFQRDEHFFLIAVNNGDENQHTIIDLHADLFEDRDYTVRDLITDETSVVNLLQNAYVRAFIHAKNGTVIEIR